MNKYKKNIIFLVIIALFVSFLILKDNFNNIIDLISKMNIWWFLVAIVFIFIYWLIQTLSLKVLADKKVSFFSLFKSTIICNFFSAITPFATGGQPFQIYFLKKKKISLGEATNLVVFQSLFYQIGLVLIGTVAIIINYFFHIFPSNDLLKKLVIIGYLINVFVIILLIIVSTGKKTSSFLADKIVKFLCKIKIIKNKEKTYEKIHKTLTKFYESSKVLKGNKKDVIKGILYNFIAFIFLYITPYFIALSLGVHDLSIINTIVAVSYVMLIGAFVPIPGGTGGIEFAFLNFFGYFVIGTSLAAILLLWRFISYYLAIIIGSIVLIIDKEGE
ncbi:MAG: lysylphosphatidylglycerol synthase transmembrane domain-containing protein [Bacilli bacterium]